MSKIRSRNALVLFRVQALSFLKPLNFPRLKNFHIPTLFFVLAHARPSMLLRWIVLSLIATKNYNKVTRHVVSLKPSIVARRFHVIPLYRSNCGFGSPCNCTECREDARRPVCEVCQVLPTVNQSSELSSDRKGISSYTFTSFCEQCWEKYTGKRRRGSRR